MKLVLWMKAEGVLLSRSIDLPFAPWTNLRIRLGQGNDWYEVTLVDLIFVDQDGGNVFFASPCVLGASSLTGSGSLATWLEDHGWTRRDPDPGVVGAHGLPRGWLQGHGWAGKA